jgi:hypothetical protein
MFGNRETRADTFVVNIKEQVIRDEPSGLTLTFWRDSSGMGRLQVTGDLPFGNRDFLFNQEGDFDGAGTGVSGTCPTGLRVVP